MQQEKAFANPLRPEWSPDGIHILIEHEEVGPNEDLYVYDLDTGDLQNITSTPSDEEFGTWSPDGTQIAFVGGPFPEDSPDLQRNLYVIDSDGDNRSLVFNPEFGASASEPAWRPDGQQIAFVCSHTQQFRNEMCFVDPDGTFMNAIGSDTNEGWMWPDWAYLGGPRHADVNCSGIVEPTDATAILAWYSDVTAFQAPPCPEIGGPIATGGVIPLWGDTDCSGTVDLSDVLGILWHSANMDIMQHSGCPFVGQLLQFG